VLSVAAMSFLGGLLAAATTVPMLGAILGLVYAILIAAWEFHAPASKLVNNSLWIISAIGIPAVCSVAVEYIFGSRRPAELLQEESTLRWEALISMFTLFAENAPHDARAEAVSRVSGLAVAGQDGMQGLYNRIVERNMDTGSLPPAARVRITMLAQLMDVAAALGSAPYADNPESLQRYARIAEQARVVSEHSPVATSPALEYRTGPNLTLLDRVEGILHAIRSMPAGVTAKDQHLVALPSNKVPLLVPGALTDRASVAFGLKISFCATLCYVLYHVIDYPGISTCVTTVFITGLSTTGAVKQKFVYRLLGSAIGGLIFRGPRRNHRLYRGVVFAGAAIRLCRLADCIRVLHRSVRGILRSH
jgi:multidrug resistance protein MdtO